MYTVVWQPAALSSLAEFWTDTDKRLTVTDAANRIDKTQKENPLEAGESRSDNRRVAFEFPLGVVFHVSEADRLVSVLRLFHLRDDGE